jgi:hypothetical protein
MGRFDSLGINLNHGIKLRGQNTYFTNYKLVNLTVEVRGYVVSSRH